MILSLLLIAAVTMALCYFVTPALARLAVNRDWLDLPHDHKRHKQPTPFVGGWVIFAAFWLGLGAAILIIPEIRRELERFVLPVFLSHLVIFAGGVLDDFVSLRVRFKFLLQICSATVLWMSGLQIDTLYVPFTGSFPLTWPLSLAVTNLWVLLIVNGMNFVDGMNGLAGGLSILTAIGLLYTAIALKIPAVAVLAILVISVMLPFLRYNFPKATVFMGDSGSQSLGFIFAVAAIYCPIKSYTVVAMFVPLLALGVPVMEVITSVTRRLAAGKPVTRADYGQMFHVMELRGFGRVKTVMFFWGVAAGLQVFVFTMFLFDRRIVFSILLIFMLIVAGWFLLLSRKEER